MKGCPPGKFCKQKIGLAQMSKVIWDCYEFYLLLSVIVQEISCHPFDSTNQMQTLAKSQLVHTLSLSFCNIFPISSNWQLNFCLIKNKINKIKSVKRCDPQTETLLPLTTTATENFKLEIQATVK